MSESVSGAHTPSLPATVRVTGPSFSTITIGGATVALPRGDGRASESPQVDVVFVFDTTGSMSDKRESLIACMTGFVDELEKLSLDWRASVLPFGDLTVSGDRVDGQLPFTDKAEKIKMQLRAMPKFSGGGNVGESSIEAMEAALGKPWRSKAVKIAMLLTDDFALDSGRSVSILDRLRKTETICFAATVDAQYYRAWAEQSGGRWAGISQEMDTAAILALLEGLIGDVASIAARVHSLGAGSVRKYLELPSAPS